MDWDQIENNWMAMTRRIRPDWASTPTPPPDDQPTAGDIDENSADWPEQTELSPVSAARMIA